MNKEVIYLEPEDDITDILTKLQQAEQKLVALVPPKKATMLRSAVNMKLVARVAKECEKIVVIVTADPAIVKMAMAARIPVAKTLQSRPVIPTARSVAEAEAEIDVIDEATGEVSTEKVAKSAKTADFTADSDADDFLGARTPSKSPAETLTLDGEGHYQKSADRIDLTEEGLENASKDPKKGEKSASKAKKPSSAPSDQGFFAKYGKWFAIGVPVALLLIVALVWAFVFAPAATITVAISSTSSNFSENVNFTTDSGSDDPAEGLFFAELFTLDRKYTVDLAASGEEDRGEHASGDVLVSFSFRLRDYLDGASVAIPAGAIFTTADGAQYSTTEYFELEWDGEFPAQCANGTFTSASSTCVLADTVTVEAVAAGPEYNLLTGVAWNDYQGLGLSNDPITGGTTDLVKVVSQADVDKAVTSLIQEHTSEGQKMLLEDLAKNVIAVEGSFQVEQGEIVVEPAVGTPLADGEKSTVTVNLSFGIYTVSKSDVEALVAAKTTLASDQKIYSIGDPYFERFVTLEEGARLKTVVETGPIVTEDTIFDKAAGRKTGEVSSILRSINGVSNVEIRTSFFWVWDIPTDRDKVTINIEMEDRK